MVLAAGLVLCLLTRHAAPTGEHQEQSVRASVPVEPIEDVPLPMEVASWVNVLGSSSEREPLTIRKRYVIPDKAVEGTGPAPLYARAPRHQRRVLAQARGEGAELPGRERRVHGGLYVPVKGEKPGSVSMDRGRP